jgi:hypothetical protein
VFTLPGGSSGEHETFADKLRNLFRANAQAKGADVAETAASLQDKVLELVGLRALPIIWVMPVIVGPATLRVDLLE